MRLAVLGGSSVGTVGLVRAIRDWPGGPDRRPGMHVTLHGRTEAKLAAVSAKCRAESASTGTSIEHTLDLAEALDGADVVLVQQRIGGLPARAFDESYPRSVGLPGEETAGPGGFTNAIRTLGALERVWPELARHAPTALVVVLTNPAGMVRQAAAAHGLRAVSVCDSPIALLDQIALARGSTRRAELPRYVGMNHFGWWIPPSVEDLGPVARLASVGLPVLEAYQALPAPYLRFFLQPGRYLAEQEGRPTRAEALIQLESGVLAGLRGELGDSSSPAPRPTPWYDLGVVPLLDAWANGATEDLVVGLANEGRVQELEAEVTVESAVTVDRGSWQVHEPVVLPPLVAEAMQRNALYERLTVDLATGPAPSYDQVLRAVLANPMVADVDRAVAVVEAIRKAPAELTGLERGFGADGGGR